MLDWLFKSESLDDIQWAIQQDNKSRFDRSLKEYADAVEMPISDIKLSELSFSPSYNLLDCAITHNAGEMIEYLIGENCSYSRVTCTVLKRKEMFELMERFFPSRGVCSICYEESDFYFLFNCAHSFCVDCLESWATSNVTNYTFNFKCTDRDCECDFDAQDVVNCLSSEALKAMYIDKSFEMAIVRKFENGYMFCPNCEEPCWTNTPSASCVTCHSCEHSFCPKCQKRPHEGWSCLEGEQMADIEDDEGFSLFWISKRSKACPQCKSSIQKNGGCSHMTCKTCQYQFCWICGRKYTGMYVFDPAICSCPTEVNPEDKYFELIPMIWNTAAPQIETAT